MNKIKQISVVDIIVLIISIAIPQMLFFWLVPESLECRLVVYSFCTIILLANALGSVALCAVKGMRIAAAPSLLSFILTLAAIGIGIVLLVVNATAKTATFILITTLLLYTLIMLVFLSTIEK